MTYFDIARYFLLYSFLGWCVEVIYHVIFHHKIVNRGFLNGPVCPVYGFGMIALIMIASYIPMTLQANGSSILSLFFIGFFMCSLIEFIAGWLMDVFFHARWWDYRNEKFNINGYVCLKFSVLWGIGTVIMLRFIHPLFATASVKPEHMTAWLIVLAICYIGYFVDFVLTTATMIGLNRRLKEIDTMQDQMKMFSDALTIALADGTLQAMATAEKAEEKKDQIKGTIQESYIETKEKTQEKVLNTQQEISTRLAQAKTALFSTEKHIVPRLLKAFPTLTSHIQNETLEELKKFYADKR